MVVLVDCSDSASPYLPSISRILSRFVDGARPGDSFACYQFSKNAVLIASGRITARDEMKQLKQQLLQLRPAGPYTSYFPALERGLADIKASAAVRPTAERLLLLITDGRRHPEDTRSETATLAELLKRHSDLKTGNNYSFYCFSVGGRIEKDLQSYLLAAGANLVNWPENKDLLEKITLVEARITDQASHIGRIPETLSHSFFYINFVTRRPSRELTMIEVSVDAEFTKGTLDRFFNVRPRRIECKQGPWAEKLALETRGFPMGDYSGVFLFQPSEPETLLLSPRRLPFDFSIAESLRVHAPSLAFGPTGFGGPFEETRTISITPRGADFPTSLDAVSISRDIELPEGLELKVSPSLKTKEIVVAVTVSFSERLPKQAGGKYEGAIRLVSAGWAFTQSEIPISVEVAGQGAGFRRVGLYVGIAAVCLAAVILLPLVSRRARAVFADFRMHKTLPVGKLIVTKDPTRGTVRNINLARLSEKKRANEVLVGTGEGVDVELPHRSMMDKTYMFSGLKTRDDVHTIVQAVRGTDEVLINDKSRTGQVQLMHFDSIKFGAFEFRFEAPKPLNQAVLYFLNSEVKQGWPLTWDTKTEGFHFLDRANLPSRKDSYVRFYELKAAAFVRDFDGELTKDALSLKVPRAGHLMKIIFADGEEITGHVFDWKNLGDKFYFFPDSMGDNVLFFLIERNTLKDIKLIQEDKEGAQRAQQKFAGILEKMKRGIGR